MLAITVVVIDAQRGIPVVQAAMMMQVVSIVPSVFNILADAGRHLCMAGQAKPHIENLT
jgi:hypothetical protein